MLDKVSNLKVFNGDFGCQKTVFLSGLAGGIQFWIKNFVFQRERLSEVFQISIFLSERTLFAGTPFLGLLNVFSEVFQYFSYPNHASTRQPLHVQG
jgi:hypothetical protein